MCRPGGGIGHVVFVAVDVAGGGVHLEAAGYQRYLAEEVYDG